MRLLADYALTETGQGGLGYSRVEAKVEPGNEASLRVATRAGLRREGERRVEPGTGDRAETTSYVVLARLASDPPLTEPAAFRALLNSFLPRKRAISQLLVRDRDGRVLICQLTYKRDWDLPGGVVEVGESPRDAAGREIEEELALAIAAGELLLTDWLPPWGGWDDAVCLVFDGGVHDPDILAGGLAPDPGDPARRVRHPGAGAGAVRRLHGPPDHLGAGGRGRRRATGVRRERRRPLRVGAGPRLDRAARERDVRSSPTREVTREDRVMTYVYDFS